MHPALDFSFESRPNGRVAYNKNSPRFYISDPVACSYELRFGVAAFWKGPSRWPSLRDLHSTHPHFSLKPAWAEESSN